MLTVGIWSSMHWFSHYRMVFCARFGYGQPYLNQSWRQVSNPMPLCLKFLTGQLGNPKPASSGHLSPSSRNWHSPFIPLLLTLVFCPFFLHGLSSLSLQSNPPAFLDAFILLFNTWAVSTGSTLHSP